jgi:hypothetical protein
MNRAEITRLLELVQQYDQREVTADHITSWLRLLGNLSFKVAEEAVHIHHKTNAFAIDAAVVLEIAAQIEARTVSAAQPVRRARMGAYNVTGALNYACERCKAEVGQTCTNKDGEETASPCVTRLVGRPINEAKPPKHRQAA